VGQGELFLLKVVGDSMIDVEATVKTFSRKDGHYWLMPANDNYAPIPADNAEIFGKVTVALRSVR
jgi:repressor LexA